MKVLQFNICECQFAFPNSHDKDYLGKWVKKGFQINARADILIDRRLPMMVSRRLSKGTQLAIEVALKILEKETEISSIVFSSRHAELIRNEKLLKLLGQDLETSPADFSVSVHNTASGMLCVQKKLKTPATSIAAGADSFHMGCVDAYGALENTEKVLLVDFEGGVPPLLGSTFPEKMCNDFPYAVALTLEQGDQWEVRTEKESFISEPLLPSALQFLRHYLLGSKEFETEGGSTRFLWRKNAS